MSTGTLVAIIIVVVVVVAAVAIVAMAAARRRRLRQRFGPEYDRVVGERGSQLKAESELAGRERRMRSLEIRPLSDTARANYASSWRTIQEQFVDQPENCVVKAQALVTTVMKDRGYPIEGRDQMLADLSVEHASTLEQYRLAQAISQSAANGQASTEDLRQAMIKYRALFSDLLGGPVARDGVVDRGGATPDGAAPDGAAPDGAAPDGAARDGAAPDGAAADGAAADGDPAGQPAGKRAARGTGPAAGASAMDADPAGASPPAANPAAADPAAANPAAASSATAGVPADELGRGSPRRGR
jgi:hypothetical protein